MVKRQTHRIQDPALRRESSNLSSGIAGARPKLAGVPACGAGDVGSNPTHPIRGVTYHTRPLWFTVFPQRYQRVVGLEYHAFLACSSVG